MWANVLKIHHLFLKKVLYAYTQSFPLHLQYVATLPCESRKSRRVTDFDRIFNTFAKHEVAQ